MKQLSRNLHKSIVQPPMTKEKVIGSKIVATNKTPFLMKYNYEF